jgi:hypothetical protein
MRRLDPRPVRSMVAAQEYDNAIFMTLELRIKGLLATQGIFGFEPRRKDRRQRMEDHLRQAVRLMSASFRARWQFPRKPKCSSRDFITNRRSLCCTNGLCRCHVPSAKPLI